MNCCLSTCISWKTSECCVFSCVIGYFLCFWILMLIVLFHPLYWIACCEVFVCYNQFIWSTGHLTWWCLHVAVICIFVQALATTEYRLSRLIMWSGCMNNPKHKYQSIFCAVCSQNCIVPPTTDVYFEAQIAVLSCFCDLCLFYILCAITHTDSQYYCQELAPGLQPIIIYGLWAVDGCTCITECCFKVCIFKYENKW